MSTVMLTNEEAREVIAHNVGRLMGKRGMSQRQLSVASGESDMAISRVVRGIHCPSAAMLARIADALSVSVDDLLRRPRNFSKTA